MYSADLKYFLGIINSSRNNHSHLHPSSTYTTSKKLISLFTTMLGRFFISLSAFTQIVGPFVADFNETHVKNPRWPPHARFHNGQTMTLGLCLGLATIYYGFRRTTPATKVDSITTAAVFGSLYWIAGLSAIWYPGTKWKDPELYVLSLLFISKPNCTSRFLLS